MQTRRSSPPPVLVLAGIALAAAVAVGCASPAPATPPPIASPSVSAPSPTPTPTADPTPVATPRPIAGGVFEVELDVAPPHAVSVIVDDRTSSVVSAASGRAGDGMSVRWGDAEVENVDADTIRVTWVGLPRDEVIRLRVSGDATSLALRFEQAAPPADSDALGSDRVLEIDFVEPVRAEDVRVRF